MSDREEQKERLRKKLKEGMAARAKEKGRTYQLIGAQLGALVDEKQKAYGDSFHKCADFLRLLYPNGVQPEQYQDMLALVRDFDKSMRIATAKNWGGENPWSDKAGYALLSMGKR